jgi:hypothetical protein
MRDTAAIPELEKPRRPQPKLQRPKPEPDVTHPPAREADVLDREDQGDSGPDKDNLLTHPEIVRGQIDRDDAHIGAREDQVSKTQAPSGEDYEDEPKQG